MAENDFDRLANESEAKYSVHHMKSIMDCLLEAIETGLITDPKDTQRIQDFRNHRAIDTISIAYQKLHDPNIKWPDDLREKLERLLTELPE